MSKKKHKTKKTANKFAANPFSTLKGFAVPVSAEPSSVSESPPSKEFAEEHGFADEMDFLGVQPLPGKQSVDSGESIPREKKMINENPALSDEELFLESLGDLDVRFIDNLPAAIIPTKPRRLKQLRQGRLIPEASLDLHGLLRHQVAEKISHFLQDAVRRQWQTLLIITGRGLHSVAGQPVLRDEAEKFLSGDGHQVVAEWGRAPRQYGGEGALVVFLKKTTKENSNEH